MEMVASASAHKSQSTTSIVVSYGQTKIGVLERLDGRHNMEHGGKEWTGLDSEQTRDEYRR